MSSAPSSPSNVQCMYLGIGQTSKTTSEAKDRGPLVCLSFFFFSLCLVTTFLSLDSFFFFLSLVSFLTLFCLVSRLLFSSLLSLLFSSLLLLSFFSPPSLLPSFPSLPSLFLTTPPLYLYRFFFSPHPTFSTFTPLPDSTPLPHLQQKLHRLLHHKNNSFYSCLSLGPLLLSSSPSACIHSPSHSFTHTHAQHYQTTTMKDDTLSFKEKYLRLRERFDRVSTVTYYTFPPYPPYHRNHNIKELPFVIIFYYYLFLFLPCCFALYSAHTTFDLPFLSLPSSLLPFDSTFPFTPLPFRLSASSPFPFSTLDNPTPVCFYSSSEGKQ